MKVIILKNNLKEGLNNVGRAVTENINLPILKSVLIKTFNNKIKLISTNLELAITQLISGKIIEDGDLTTPFSVLNNIIINSDDERIELESKNNNLFLKTTNYEANIQGLSSEEFPIIPKIENNENFIKIDSLLFKDSLFKIINAAQISEIRPEISGVLFDFQISNLKLVTTDSFRLAEKTLFDKDFKSSFQQGFKIIIPLKTIQEIIKILSGGDLYIYIDPNQILFKNNDLEIISRLIDGEYPDYDPILPKELKTECFLNKEQFLNAIKLVSNFSGRVNDIRIKTKDKGRLVEVFSANSYLGENKYLIPAKTNGDDFDVAFNWRYLMDGLKNFDSEEVVFGVNGEQKPAIIKSIQDISYFYILMPIKNN